MEVLTGAKISEISEIRLAAVVHSMKGLHAGVLIGRTATLYLQTMHVVPAVEVRSTLDSAWTLEDSSILAAGLVPITKISQETATTPETVMEIPPMTHVALAVEVSVLEVILFVITRETLWITLVTHAHITKTGRVNATPSMKTIEEFHHAKLVVSAVEEIEMTHQVQVAPVNSKAYSISSQAVLDSSLASA